MHTYLSTKRPRVRPAWPASQRSICRVPDRKPRDYACLARMVVGAVSNALSTADPFRKSEGQRLADQAAKMKRAGMRKG